MSHDDANASTREVYDFSAAYYASAVGTVVSAEFERPVDRAVLHAFAEELAGVEGALVLDVGCGVGRVAALLSAGGLDVRGFDLSSEMVAQARLAHPHLQFEVAPMTELPVESNSVAAVVLWYSIIHSPLAALGDLWRELNRVLTSDGKVLVAFQAGANELVQRENAYGSSATLTWHRHDPDDVVTSAERSGFTLQTRIWRKAELPHETTPQAFLVFRR